MENLLEKKYQQVLKWISKQMIRLHLSSLANEPKRGKMDHPTGWSKLSKEHCSVDSGSMLVLKSLTVSNKLLTALFWQFIKISLNKMW